MYVETCTVSADLFLGVFESKTEKINTGHKLLNKNGECGKRSVGVSFSVSVQVQHTVLYTTELHSSVIS